MIRITGDTIALSPPLIVSEAQIGEIFDKVARVIKRHREPKRGRLEPSYLHGQDARRASSDRSACGRGSRTPAAAA